LSSNLLELSFFEELWRLCSKIGISVVLLTFTLIKWFSICCTKSMMLPWYLHNYVLLTIPHIFCVLLYISLNVGLIYSITLVKNLATHVSTLLSSR
jgi:hypothetical protein